MKNYFAQSIIQNGGFEEPIGTEWKTFGNASIYRTIEKKFGGDYSMKIELQDMNYAGIRQGPFFCYAGMPLIIVFAYWKSPYVDTVEMIVDWATTEGTIFTNSTYTYAGLSEKWWYEQQILLAVDKSATFYIRFQAKAKHLPAKFFIDSVFIPAIVSPRVDSQLILLTKVV